MTTEDEWKPKLNKYYYWLSCSSVSRGFHARLNKKRWEDDRLDRSLYKSGNCFKSKKEARFIFDSFRGLF